MLNLLKKWFKGEYGLAKTYWLFGVLGFIIVFGTAFIVVDVAKQLYLIKNAKLYHQIFISVSILKMLYATLASVAVINSATYKRTRGLWGWIATIIAVCVIAEITIMAAVLSNDESISFEDHTERYLTPLNSVLPKRIDDVAVLTRMDSRKSDKAILMYVTLDFQIEDEEAFVELIKPNILNFCSHALLYIIFDGPVSRVEMIYTQPNKDVIKFSVEQFECR